MNLVKQLLFSLLITVCVNSSYAASPKEVFIKSVAKQCKITEKEAEKFVTAGRTGTVITFKLCPRKTMTLKNGCVITCGKEGASL